MKKWKNSIFLLLFLIGLGLILYPIVSSKVEDWSHSKAIADYRSQVAENAAQLEKIEAATAWANSGSLSAEDVTARTNGEYRSVAFETAGSLTQPTGLVRIALPAGLLEGKTLVRIAPDGTQTEMPFETERGTIILTLDFANSALPVMLFRLVPQTAAL